MKPTAPHFLLLTVGAWINRRQLAAIDYLYEENRVLRERLGGRRMRLTNAQRRRLAAKGKALGRKTLGDICTIVTPDTILRRYRQLIANKYDGNAKRGPGRPRTRDSIRKLVIGMAKDNARRGYTRLVGALRNVGLVLGRTTVKRILAEQGFLPAPERGKRTSWSTFLRADWDAIAGADFFTVALLSLWGLTGYFVFFVIDLETRRVHIAGVVHQPYGQWMMQIGRNVLDEADGFLRGCRYLILDRDPVHTEQFRRLLQDAGVRPVRLPARRPNLNAYAERFVRSIRSECLHHVIPLSEGHLRTVLHQFVEHCHLERNHQGLDNELIQRRPTAANDNGPVQRKTRLGGLLSYDHREAA